MAYYSQLVKRILVKVSRSGNSYMKVESQTWPHFIDNDGEVIGKTAEEFWEWIIRNNYTVSGYGTVYSQDSRGFLPTILEDWFSQRKNYQKRKNEAKNKMDEILEKYKR